MSFFTKYCAKQKKYLKAIVNKFLICYTVEALKIAAYKK